MRASATSRRFAWLRQPHAARLAISWLLVGIFLAGMVAIPSGLYFWGKAVRNRLAFEVAPFELATERAGRRMAIRERTLRAFLYEPSMERLREWEDSRESLDRALDELDALARAHEPQWAERAAELSVLADRWQDSAARVIAARDGVESLAGAGRPGPIYDEYQSVLGDLQEEIAATKGELVVELAATDDARVAMPVVLALLSLPVLVYISRLSSRVLALLQATHADRERLSATLEHMVDPVLVTDARGMITLLNPAARATLGIGSGARIGALGPRLAPARREGAPAPSALLAEIERAGQVRDAEVVVTREGGGALPVSISSGPIRVAGETIGAVTVLRDLSDRLRYEEKRLEAERFLSLGAMAERVTHDFGNYLEAASAATVMLERPSSSDPALRARWIGVLRATFEEGRNALAGLRTLSFLAHAPRLAPTDLGAVVDRAIDVARLARPRADGVVVERVSSGPAIEVDASEPDLARAIVNVVVNAIDASPPGGRVEVRCEHEDERARVVVRDEGHGIAPEHQGRIFEMYFTTKGERGSGIGLTLAREVLRVHGGDVHVESSEGPGAVFVLDLPGRVAPPAHAMASADAVTEVRP